MADDIEGSLGLLPALLEHRRSNRRAEHPTGELYQTSLINALMQGVYEGTMSYGALREHGDFGLGTFNELDGEMVGFDGEFYQLRSDGSARLVDPEQKTPFAVVTFFQPDIVREISSPTTKPELQQLIEELTEANLFHAIKVSGDFTNVITRTVGRQKKPHPKLTDAAHEQQTKSFQQTNGTLAGFRSPRYAEGISVPGFHLHFLRADHQAGGHALDYVLTQGRLELAAQHAFHVELPQTSDFERADLEDPNLAQMIQKAEE